MSKIIRFEDPPRTWRDEMADLAAELRAAGNRGRWAVVATDLTVDQAEFWRDELYHAHDIDVLPHYASGKPTARGARYTLYARAGW